jgi:iron complex outermembrane receptor protein
VRTGLGIAAMAIMLTGAAVAQTTPQTTTPQTTTPQTPTSQAVPPTTELPPVEVIGTSPLIGSGVDRDTVPAETNVLKGDDLTRGGTTTPDVVRSLNEQVGGVNLDSASGNPYQPTLNYHGFLASPLQGTPQGLAVYVNGVRFNQAFGDTVNFDQPGVRPERARRRAERAAQGRLQLSRRGI